MSNFVRECIRTTCSLCQRLHSLLLVKFIPLIYVVFILLILPGRVSLFTSQMEELSLEDFKELARATQLASGREGTRMPLCTLLRTVCKLPSSIPELVP